MNLLTRHTELLWPAIIVFLAMIILVFVLGSDKIKTYTSILMILVLLTFVIFFCGHLFIQDIEFCMVTGCL